MKNQQQKKALKVICENFGSESIQENHHPSMAGEDFSFMLDEVPGAYIHVGSGDDNHKHGLHSPYYDFNDEIIPTGVTLLSQLAIKSLETQV
jgi:hippurate hydrolase